MQFIGVYTIMHTTAYSYYIQFHIVRQCFETFTLIYNTNNNKYIEII